MDTFQRNGFRFVTLLWLARCIFSQQMNYHETGNGVSSGSGLGSTYFFYQRVEYPRDCKEARDQCSSNNSSGVYLIKPDGYPEPFEAYCKNSQDSGGWTVILRRHDGAVYFNRNWSDYKIGFGFLNDEFWLGNDKISYLTNQKKYELRIEMTNYDGISFFVSYDAFSVGDEFSNYNLASLVVHNGTANLFTTWCQRNTGYGECTCQRTCEDPYGCLNTCSELETCVCPEGYYLKERTCVPPERCGCFALEGKLIPEGEFYVNSDCSRKASCNNGQLTWDDTYECSSNAVCDTREEVTQCYCNSGYIGDGLECSLPADCLDIYSAGFTDSGIYSIKPSNWPGSHFEVYCNMSDGGGWTVFQRRVDGSVGFYRNWNSYKEGFGSPDNELWIGNEQLYYLTNQKRYTIRIDLVDRYGSPYFAKFNYFRISGESDKYRLSQLGIYSGTADSRSNPDGDALRHHFNQPFSTYDRDNDADSRNCAKNCHGAWWYTTCHRSNLNGDYHASCDSVRDIAWTYLQTSESCVKFTEMKIRPF